MDINACISLTSEKGLGAFEHSSFGKNFVCWILHALSELLSSVNSVDVYSILR